jgi:hypothetical protein
MVSDFGSCSWFRSQGCALELVFARCVFEFGVLAKHTSVSSVCFFEREVIGVSLLHKAKVQAKVSFRFPLLQS